MHLEGQQLVNRRHSVWRPATALAVFVALIAALGFAGPAHANGLLPEASRQQAVGLRGENVRSAQAK